MLHLSQNFLQFRLTVLHVNALIMLTKVNLIKSILNDHYAANKVVQ